jgi:hypothetical protein
VSERTRKRRTDGGKRTVVREGATNAELVDAELVEEEETAAWG